MINIKIYGHNNYYGVADVLRLYSDEVKEDKEGGQVIGVSDLDVTIISEVIDDVVYTYVDGTPRNAPTNHLEQIDTRRDVKRSLYLLLNNVTGKDMPWGCLTGIRPTLVAKEENFSAQSLENKYMVREDKAKHAAVTATNEERILSWHGVDELNIYVGVPFCPSRCEYCSFISQDVLHHLDRLGMYKDALIHEIKAIAPKIRSKIASVYIGGGTPTVFNDQDFGELIDVVRSELVEEGYTEFTVEAGRPDTITEYKLQAMSEAGVGRICINPQTMRDETLTRLNRRHSVDDIIRTLDMARGKGIKNINMDLIAGLKYENSEDFLYSLNKVMELNPENITIHTLYKKRRAAMSRSEVLDKYSERGDVDKAVREGYKLLEEGKYIPYYLYRQKDTGHGLENTGFALSGSECYYNVAMMTDRRSVLSFGAGGVSKRIFDAGRLERCPCIKDAMGYIRQVDEMVERKLAFLEGSVFI